MSDRPSGPRRTCHNARMAAQPPTGAPTFATLGADGLALVNDEPVAAPGDDVLGTGPAAAQLARLLHASRASTPFTLAVDAGWGWASPA